MKKIILSLTVLLFVFSSNCYAQKDESVYLKAISVEASSFDATPDWAPLPDAKAIVDGSLMTRWSSDYLDNQWITVDFGIDKTLDKIILFWEAAYAPDYDILVSSDNQNWQPLVSLKDQDGDTDEIEFAPVKARFVKILGVKRINPDWGTSLWEAIFLGPAGNNPSDKPLNEVYPKLAKKLNKEVKSGVSTGEESVEEPVSSPAPLSIEEFHKGVVYTSWKKTELGEEASDQTLEYLSQCGAGHLGIMVVWYQDTNEEKTIYSDEKDTPDYKSLGHAINKAHSLGMKVMLKPHVDIKTGQWRGDIIPSKEWFDSYKKYLLEYAKLAEKYNVELFSVGTELVNTTISMWEKDWEDIIAGIKEVYSGKLVYSANWDEYTTVSFWDKLDIVGLDAYFPLTAKKNPTKEELIAGWKSSAAELENWLKKNKIDKPIVFTEVGYCSADGTNIQPWSVLSDLSSEHIDEEEQADCLDAMVTVCSAYPWFKGFYWWNYFPQKRWSPLGYNIRGKKAEKVFNDWLKRL